MDKKDKKDTKAIENNVTVRFIPTGDQTQYFEFYQETVTKQIYVTDIQDIAQKDENGIGKNLQIKYLRNKYQIGLPFALAVYKFALETYKKK